MQGHAESILEGLLTLDQTAKELGIHVVTLKRWKALGKGPEPRQLGVRWYYSRQEWRDYILKNGLPGRAKKRSPRGE
jgi:predicted site-specific integrase-resolvase